MSTEEAEVVGFDGDGVVIDGGVSPAVMDEARSRKEAFERKYPDSEPPKLADYILDIQAERGELPGQKLADEYPDIDDDVLAEALNRRRAFERKHPDAEPPKLAEYIEELGHGQGETVE